MRTCFVPLALATLCASTAHAEIIAIANSSGTLIRWDTNDLSAPIGSVTIRNAANPGGSPLVLGIMAYRPSDGLIYASGNQNQRELWRIDPASGLATQVGIMNTEPGSIVIDLNPATDEIHVLVNQSSACIHYRVDPDTAAIIAGPVLLEPANNPQIYSTTFTREPNPRFLGIENIVNPETLVHIGAPGPGNVTYLAPVPLPASVPYGGFDTSFTDPNIAYFAWTMFPVPPSNPQDGELATINLTTGAYTRLMNYQGPGFFTTNLVVLPAPTPPPACPGDANASNSIDGADLSVLLGQFGTSVTPGSGADFNNDGLVNAADLSVLLANFGSSC